MAVSDDAADLSFAVGWRSRLLALFLMLLSPLGAPVVGFALVSICADGFDAPFRCSVPEPVLDYFVPFVLMPFIWVGPFLAILWLLLASALLLGIVWTLVSAVGRSIVDRI